MFPWGWLLFSGEGGPLCSGGHMLVYGGVESLCSEEWSSFPGDE